MGHVADPYDDDDDDLGVVISDLPEEPEGEVPTTPDGRVLETDADRVVDDVEYDLDGWSSLEHEAVTRGMVEAGIPHHWDDHRLVVGRAHQQRAEAILDDVAGVGEPLDPDIDQVAYNLEEWDDDRLVTLGDALADAEIPFDWDGDELFVYEEDEQRVDELLDKVAHPHELSVDEDEADGGAELMGELFLAADRLLHDPDNHEASVTMLDLSRMVEKAAPPFGLARKDWSLLQERVNVLCTELTSAPIDENTTSAAAGDLRNAIRPYV